MYRFITSIAVVLTLILPSIAWAGGPESESPEPSFWMFLFLGAVPLCWFLYKQNQANQTPTPVQVRNDP